jgi:hypothetical protein
VRALRFAVFLLLLCAARGSAGPLAVPLTMREPAGVGRTNEPVTVGVPCPRGRVRDAATLWVADGAGRPTPTQVRVLERWADGSARWLLVDFLAAVGAHETATYRLRDGKHPSLPPSASVLRTSETEDDRVLDAGPVGFVVPKSGTPLLRAVRRGGAELPIRVDEPGPVIDGVDQSGVRDRHLSVETDGPVRTELLVSGRYASDLTYDARLAAFAGTPWLRVQLTLTSLSQRPYSHIRSFPLAIGFGADAGELGLGSSVRRFASLASPHRVAQPDAQHVRLDGEPVRNAADGWARATGPATVTVVRRYFREEWPQALAVSKSGLTADLLAGDDDPVELGIGAAKTFELWIAVEDPAHPTDARSLATRLQHPLVAAVDPDWIIASEALPNAIAPSTPGARDLLPRLETGIERYLGRNRAERWDDGPPVPCEQRTKEHERVGAFGALNWGDWNFPGYRDRSKGCDAWGNLEYDLTQVLGLAWGASGSRTDWDAFIAAARHYRDVDVIHFAPGHEEIVGFNHPHKVKHFAFEAKQTIDLGHTWLEGLFTHYRLTGEVRSLEAAKGIADVIVRRQSKAGNPRQYGWPMIALVAAYDATGDTNYRDSAHAYATAAVVVHDATPAAGDWKMGILADGIAGVFAITHDERLRQWLVGYADVLVRESARFSDPRYALPLGYLSRQTGNARYRALALETVKTMSIGDWGKTLAISGRTGFRILGGLGVPATPPPAPTATPARAAPRRGSASAPPRR